MSPIDIRVSRGLTPVTGPSGNSAAELKKLGVPQEGGATSPADLGEQCLEARIAIGAAAVANRLPTHAIPLMVRSANGPRGGGHHQADT